MAYNGKGKGKGKGKEASVEFMFTEALRKSGDYAVVGDEIAEWTGCRWKPLSPAERNRVAASWIEKNDPSSLTSGKVASCAGIAASLLPELSLAGVGPIVATRKAWLIPTEDGRFRAMAPDRSLGVTHACELDLPDDGSGFYTPSPVPEDSDFGRFLVTSLPDPELRRAVQQFCGYTLLPTVNVQTAHVWIGEGGNGKGLLKALLGRFHPRTAAIDIRDLSGFGLGGVVGASLLTVDEAPKGLVDSQTLKSLISGDAIEIQRKFRDPVTYRPTGKVLICTNHNMVTNDHSEGFWRRQIIVPWEVSLGEGERDHDLERRIVADEMRIVFDWFLAGAADFLSSGCKLFVAAKSEERKAQAMVSANSALSWLHERDVDCRPMPEDRYARKASVFTDYVKWCGEANLKAYGAVEFWKVIRKRHPGLDESRRRFGETREICVNIVFDASLSAPTPEQKAEDVEIKAELTSVMAPGQAVVAETIWRERHVVLVRSADAPFDDGPAISQAVRSPRPQPKPPGFPPV